MQATSRHELIVVFLLGTLLGFFNFRLIYAIQMRENPLRVAGSIDPVPELDVLLLPMPYCQRSIRLPRSLRRNMHRPLPLPYWLPRVWRAMPA